MPRNTQAIGKLIKIVNELGRLKSDLHQIRKQHSEFNLAYCLTNHYSNAGQTPSLQKGLKAENINNAKMIKNLREEHDKQNKCMNKIDANNDMKSSLNQKAMDGSIRLNIESQAEALRMTIINQLSEIRVIEKEEEAIGKANQQIKHSNSEHKRYMQRSLPKNAKSWKVKECVNDWSMNNRSQTRKDYKNMFTSQSSTMLDGSQIAVSIPLSLKVRSQLLKCQKGHEYYEGSLNEKGLPDGNGRIDVCCKQIPNYIGGPSLDNALFYQGQFKSGKFHGYGTLKYRGGVKYVGEFNKGLREGKGSLYHNGTAETAKWQNDEFISVI